MTRDELRKRVMSKIMDYAEAYEAIPKADPDPAEYADAILALIDQAKGVPVEPSDDTVERAASAIREHVEPSHPDTIDIIIGVDDAAKAVLAALKPGDKVGDGCVVVPVKPTDAMAEAGTGPIYDFSGDTKAREVYTAMLAALNTGETE